MRFSKLAPAVAAVLLALASFAAQTVPTDVQMPGTQPQEIIPPTPSWNCGFCHSNVNPDSEPWFNWQGSMMGHASSDPMFWAALAIAEQGFQGSGDLCLRCHVVKGWVDGRSTPTDGSGLATSDLEGVSCDVCHKLTNPDDSEHVGVQNAPFIANDGGNPKKAFRGSGMYVLWGGSEKLGPYSDPQTPHTWKQSKLHRSADLCATCHDVSNPVTGDLAHNNGAPLPLAPGQFSGIPGAPVTDKAAFKNFPHQYGVVERTGSEHRANALATLKVGDFHQLPSELKSGSIRKAFDAAVMADPSGNYLDGTVRLFSCQSCHMRPVLGAACNLPFSPERPDNPKHDMTGGNYWMGRVMQWLDAQGRLRREYPFSPEQIAALDAGALRAVETLNDAAGMTVTGNTLRIVNRTGHKLITGYPEGRRMWVRVRWYDGANGILRTDGEYGAITAQVAGQPTQVDTLLAPHDPNTHVVQVINGMTQQWAQQLLGFGVPGSLPLSFDRLSGAVTMTLAGLAATAPGTEHETFHFVLNNTQMSDNRIPPFKLSYDDARTYNALPVPPTQFGNPGPGGYYQHWSDIALAPPAGASRADIELLYQPTSWEYMQFLNLANNGAILSLATVGQDMLDAWFATGMAAPEVIARAQWGTKQPVIYCTAKTNSLGCVPAIGWFGEPSATRVEGFQITASELRNNKPGLLLFSRAGRAATPFGGGVLCLAQRIKRTAIQTAGGRPTGNNCSGGLSVDFNTVIASGIDVGLIAGATVQAQYWGRDQGFAAPNNITLTDALEFVIGP